MVTEITCPSKLSCSFTEYSWKEAMDTPGQQCRNSSYTTRNFLLNGIDILWPGTKIMVLECMMECCNVDSNIYQFTNKKAHAHPQGRAFEAKYLLLRFVIWWITWENVLMDGPRPLQPDRHLPSVQQCGDRMARHSQRQCCSSTRRQIVY